MKFNNLIPAVLLLSAWFILGCSGKPDMDDPEAVAHYICAQTQEIQELAMQDMDEEERDQLVRDFQVQVREFEGELRLHHGEDFPDFNARVEKIFVETCRLEVPNLPEGPIEPIGE